MKKNKNSSWMTREYLRNKSNEGKRESTPSWATTYSDDLGSYRIDKDGNKTRIDNNGA